MLMKLAVSFILLFILLWLSSSQISNTTNCVNGYLENGICNCIQNYFPPTCQNKCDPYNMFIDGVIYDFYYHGVQFLPKRNSIVFGLTKTLNDLDTRAAIRPLNQPLNSTSFKSGGDCTLLPSNKTGLLGCVYLSSLQDLNLGKCLGQPQISGSSHLYSGYMTFWTRKIQQIQPSQPGGEVITDIKDAFSNIPFNAFLPKNVVASNMITVLPNATQTVAQVYFSIIQEESSLILSQSSYNSVEIRVLCKSRSSAGFVLKYLFSSPQGNSLSEIGSRSTEDVKGLPYFVQYWEMKTTYPVPKYTGCGDGVSIDFDHNFQILKCPTETITNPNCEATLHSQLIAKHNFRSGNLCGQVTFNGYATGALTFHTGSDFAAQKSVFSTSDTIFGKVVVSVKTSADKTLQTKSVKMESFVLSGLTQAINLTYSVTPTFTLAVNQGLTTLGAEAGLKYYDICGGVLGFSFNAKSAFGANSGSLTATANVLIEYADKVFESRSLVFRNFERALDDATTAQMQSEVQGKFKLIEAHENSGTEVLNSLRMAIFSGIMALLMLNL